MPSAKIEEGEREQELLVISADNLRKWTIQRIRLPKIENNNHRSFINTWNFNRW